MLIIKISGNENHFHPIEFQSHRNSCWVEGYIGVPPALVDKVSATEGYCDLVIENGTLKDVVPKTELKPKTDEKQTNSPQDDTDTMLVDHEYRLTLLELGVNE